MRRPPPDSPWGLPQRCLDSVKAMLAYGTYEAAGQAIGVLPSTISTHLQQARARLGVQNSTRMVAIVAEHFARQELLNELIAKLAPRSGEAVPVADIMEMIASMRGQPHHLGDPVDEPRRSAP